MDPSDLEKNRAAWNAKTPYHVRSRFYDVEGFLGGETSLNPLEQKLVGDVRGRSLLHLQCHFGLDTLSFARLGARACGLDFSSVALDQARDMASQAKLDARFACADVHEAPAALNGETFDVVFTSYGAIGWLPNMDAWAKAAAACVAPGGKLVVVEFHPFVWIWDETFSEVAYPWNSNGQKIEETDVGTYADRDAPLRNDIVGWNHGLGAVVSAIAKQGLVIDVLEETTRSPYNVFHSGETTDDGTFIIGKFKEGVPLVYGLVASRPLNASEGSSSV